MAKDPRYIKIINSQRWKILRANALASQPFCEECEKMGVYTLAECVHHKKPVEDGRDEAEMIALAYDPENLQPLCRKHHDEIHNRMGSHSHQHSKAAAEARNEAQAANILSLFE